MVTKHAKVRFPNLRALEAQSRTPLTLRLIMGSCVHQPAVKARSPAGCAKQCKLSKLHFAGWMNLVYFVLDSKLQTAFTSKYIVLASNAKFESP